MTSIPHSARFKDVLDEHRQLRDLVRLLQISVLRPHPTAHVVRRLVNELEAALRKHFEHEEHGGYLHDALSAAPQLSNLAVRLLEEHAAFLDFIASLRQLCLVATETHDWREVADAYTQFSRRFEEHEAAENRLVQDAMLRDMQAED